MSVIKIKGSSANTGDFTIQPPNGATDRTLTLPDATTTLSGNVPLGYDSWYLTANDATVGTHQLDGWTRDTSSVNAQIGSAMSESNSYWTFPSTGLWLIRWMPFFVLVSGDQVQTYMRVTTDDNATYTDVGSVVAGPGWNHGHNGTQYLFDVEDTSTHKFRFIASSIDVAAGSYLAGGSIGSTYAQFMKIGET